MAPIPNKIGEEMSSVGIGPDIPAGERVVISGMSGLYPNARHVKDLADILYNKLNPVTLDNSRWTFNHSEMTGYTGKVPDLNYFDAQFFKVNLYLGNNMDVMSRKVLEQAHMAIYDAGVNPEQLNGKKVGVYIGLGDAENAKTVIYNAFSMKSGLTLLGCNKSMFANRISYWLNTKGPSICVDQACCSSTLALELGYRAMLRGDCEAAIVGGCNLCLHPHSLIHYGRLLKLSKNGKTMSFDENADGSVKSESINVLFLQKAKDALRIYAQLVNIKNEFSSLIEDETGPRYGLYRNPTDMIKFLKQFYEESNVPPEAIEYVEGCGSGIPESDKAELEAYEKVFCEERINPLLVGSVMSNIGNVEAASGIAAITKVLLGYQTGILAGNLHCNTPRRDVMALRDGRMTIVNENVPFGHGFTAVNGLSVTGVNSHLILKGYNKPKNLNRYKSRIPHLVLVSGRQDTAVIKILNDLKSRPIDPEEIALLNNAHGVRTSGHLGRGFTILDVNGENKTVCISEKAAYFDYAKRPLWFVYSGMGSQYNGMGTDLMRIPVFAAAIERCHRALQPKGIDIVHIITSPDKSIFDNILHSFVGIAAIQIGLTDVLRELGIVPDKIIGHSVGELGCAYADDCFTTEEMILSAYSRGLVSIQTSFIRGSMAAVGIGYQQIFTMVPPEIEVACHNSPDSCTISGPSELMEKFVAGLVNKGIFAKEVPCSNIAYHSRYIAHAAPGLLKYLSEVIKTPKERSERWVSTSVPRDKWLESYAKYSSAEYHTNNLLNSVLFEEASCLIPWNAILIEIAPHGLLQSILKRSLPETCTNIPLTRRGHSDNAVFLLEAIGNLYIEGINPKIQSLYPKIEFPVSTGTPMLSHLVEWVHNEHWAIPLHSSGSKRTASTSSNIISLHDKEHSYLQGHVIGGKTLFPFSAMLVAVWDTLAMTLGVPKRRLPVQFHDVMLKVQPIMHDQRQLHLSILLIRGNGRFEVLDDMDSVVATGYIKDEKNDCKIFPDVIKNQTPDICSKEIYDHFLLRGFSYKDSFKSIHSSNLSLTDACIHWSGNWVTFIDGMLQLNNLRHSHESYSHPSFISKLSIYPDQQDKCGDILKIATVLETYNVTKCGGVVMENIEFDDLPMPNEYPTKLRKLKFIPHFASEDFDFETILQVYLQIVVENVGTRSVSVLGIYNNRNTLSKLLEIKRILEDVPDITTNFTCLKMENFMKKSENIYSELKLVLVFNLTNDDYMCHILHKFVQHNTFIINIRNSVNNLTKLSRPSGLYQVVCDHSISFSQAVELARWRPTNSTAFTSVISVYSPSDFALLIHEKSSLLPHQNLLVMTTYPAVPGLTDILNHFKNKSGCSIRVVMNESNDKDLDDHALINIDLAVKVIKNGVYGGMYYVPLYNTCNGEDSVTLQSHYTGQVKSLKWVQASLHKNSSIPVKVQYATLNGLDAKRFSGLIPPDTISKGYGMDFSGITESGARVMGLVDCGSVSTNVQVHPDLLWPVPEHWSLEDAATVPFAYSFAYYCLAIKYKLYPGKRVLVHGAAGGLGQAILSLALANCCEVFATVSDVRKKQFLLKIYPGLKEENIGNSRDETFSDLVFNNTNGEGVDLVILSLNGVYNKNVSLKCAANFGVTIDVNQIPSRENFDYGMYYMTKSRSYIPVDFFSIFNERGNFMKQLQRMVSDGITRGWVRPLSRVVYAPGDVSRAFQLLGGSNQRGRVLVDLQQADIHALNVQPRLQCSSEKLHVVVSDHKHFGLQIVDTLISRGVKKVYLSLPASSETFQFKIRQWQKQNVQVYCECTEKYDIPGFLMEGTTISPEHVEGIYILITIKQSPISETNTFVDKVDNMTRKTYPNLKYFVVINTVNSVGEEMCISRNKDEFAATMLRLPELKEIENINTQEGVSIREAVDAVECAITSEESVLTAHVVSSPPPSLLHQLAALAGLNMNQDIKSTTTLSDLGINPTNANIVSTYLRNTYNICFTVDKIQALTIERIQHIDKILSRTEFENDKSLNKLFTYVDTDEILTTSEMVFMPTLTSNTILHDQEFDVSLPYLCIVPGIEGHYRRFKTLCKRLKLPALVLHPDLDRPDETIPEMASRFATKLSLTARPKTHFYLLGYESGVFVVLEMAAILEENGFTALIFCIGAPDEIHLEIKDHLRGLESTEVLQDAIIRHFCFMMTNNETDQLELALQGVFSWHDKLTVTVRALLGKISHSAQYARQLIVAAYGRIASLLQYKLKVRALRSQIIILQPMSTNVVQQTDLQQYSQHPVIRHELQAPLSQATEDARCAEIINSHLDAKILDEFEEKNLCDSYFLDTNGIITWTV